jgi:hypothetical protein
MSALGNGYLSGFDFKEEAILSTPTTTSTLPVPNQYNSKLIGGKRRKTKLSSLRSNKSLKSIRFSIKSHGGSKKSRKNRKSTKKFK